MSMVTKYCQAQVQVRVWSSSRTKGGHQGVLPGIYSCHMDAGRAGMSQEWSKVVSVEV